LVWVSAGFLFALILTLFDYRHFERISYPFYAATVIMLAIVLSHGRSALGAQRWLQLGPLSVQPSELAKLALALGMAKFFTNYRGGIPLSFLGLFWPVALTAIPFVFILKQPDLGTGLVVASISGAMVLFVGVRKRILFTFLVVIAVTAPIAWNKLLRPYQKARISTFLNPEADARGKGYQTIQSKIAIGSGELTGKGYLNGTQKKYQFVPKQHTDFVFSTFAEEFGFIGSVFVLLLYASFALLGLNVAYTAKERFGMLLAVGLTALISLQAVINLGMEMGSLPVVGVTLPLFSYGGTSFLTTMFAVGVLLNISMRRYMF
jgi:rod shape determining protein RodA